MRIKTKSHETFSLSNEWKRRNNKKKNSAEETEYPAEKNQERTPMTLPEKAAEAEKTKKQQ